MTVALISANLGSFDVPQGFPVQEGVNVDVHFFTEANFPPRYRAMTPRLQAKIPKMFGWQLRPDYDAYLWLDASLVPSRPDTVAWFLAQLGEGDIAVYRHPWRQTAAQEAEYLRTKMAAGSHYLKSRYENEDLDGQMAAIANDRAYQDDRFYAGGAFCYRHTPRTEQAMREWWYHTTRFHCIDQLAFAYALHTAGCAVNVIDEDIYHASHVAWTRRSGHG